MQYKVRYRPLERLTRDGWRRIGREEHQELIDRAVRARRSPDSQASPAKDASLPQLRAAE
jgi:arginine-tRNA-protein transferase